MPFPREKFRTIVSALRTFLLPIFPLGTFTRMRVRLSLLSTEDWMVPFEEEKLDLEWLSRQIPNAKLLLEVGANSGSDSLRLLEAFPDATLHCFEPDPRAQKQWHASVRDSRATLHAFALGNEDGKVRFFQSDFRDALNPGAEENGWTESGSIHAPRNHLVSYPWVSFKTEIEVTCLRLDSFIAETLDLGESEVIDFIWADVQGAERELILGGINSFHRVRFVYTEYSIQKLYESQINLREIARMLPSFRIKKLWDTDVLFENISLNQSQWC